MLIKSKLFGEIEIQEESIINFPYGIIAFEDMKRFFIIESGQEELPFCWLQSADDGNLVFLIIDPFIFKKDYEFTIPESTLAELDIEKAEDVAVFSIIVIPEDASKMSANLLAPLIVNTKNFKGKQIILNDKVYSTKYYLLEELKKAKGAVEDAGAK